MLISLQALRALAAWIVVCHHFMQIFFDFHAAGPIGQFFTDRGAVGVDIFFVISGLVIYLSTQDKQMPAGRFLLNRVIRIVPAYWLYTALMGLMLVSLGQWLPHAAIDLPHFILSLLFIPSENPGGYGLYPTLNVGWTLNYEMFFYLLFSLVFTVPQRYRPLIVAAALVAVSEVLGRYGVVSRFYQNNIIYEFLLGIGIGMLYRRGWIAQGLWLPLAVIIVSAVLIYHLDSSDRLLHWGWPSALIVLACVAMEPHFRGSRLLKTLGDCSYSVYLVHVLVLYAGWLASVHWHLNPYWVFAFCVPTIALVSWASYVWIEKRLYHRVKHWTDARLDSTSMARTG
ncbi:acyltransferase [Pseudomonas sp. CFBP 8758]|uniref:acyltransferase family protein n=1 Tax=Pseudomonas sp. CFBP 8758 TaxID=2775286 RepID=UPI00177D4596|nr:acyltransferase [Pseudomonas sp. CFBP 8758]MBD8595356.1 acyltransferase [Pseudomonas sp. CFBP 8758]